jgi:hypothetical protein
VQWLFNGCCRVNGREINCNKCVCLEVA